MTTPWPEDIAITIPAFKAAELLSTLLPHVLTTVPPSHILVVDDASGDTTANICRDHAVRYTAHATNKGKGAALSTGFTHLMNVLPSLQWIITMDADGQHSPEDLPLFIAASLKTPAAGICIGARTMKRGSMPPARILSNRLTSLLLGWLCNLPIQDSQCGYRLYNTDLLKRTSCHYKRFEMESEIIMKAAFIEFPITFVPIQTLYLDGPSYISHLYDTLRWISAVVQIRLQRRQFIKQHTSQQIK